MLQKFNPKSFPNPWLIVLSIPAFIPDLQNDEFSATNNIQLERTYGGKCPVLSCNLNSTISMGFQRHNPP